MNNKILIFSTIIISMFLFAGCDKEDEGFPAGSTERKTQDVVIEIQQFMSTSTLSTNLALGFVSGGRIATTTDDCVVTDIDYEGDDTIVKLDFGTGCSMQGSTISGKFYAITKSDAYVYRYDNLIINGDVYNGTFTMNMANPDAMFITEWIYVHDLSITKSQNNETTYFSSELHIETDGNMVKMVGEYSGSSNKGYSFDANITSALQVTKNCMHKDKVFPIEGIESISYIDTSGELKFTVDYGDGKCNAIAKVNVENGPTFNLDLTKR